MSRQTLREFFSGLFVLGLAAACWPFCALADAINASRGCGMASWYGEDYRGLTMANGKPFDPDAMTCAHPTLPLGERIGVRRVETGRTVWVVVTDRGPDRKLDRVVDLSRAAFARLAPLHVGLIEVEIILAASVTGSTGPESRCVDPLAVAAATKCVL